MSVDVATATALVERGDRLVVDRRLGAAEAAYRDAVAVDPANAVAHNNLGWVLERTGRLDEAIARYRSAARLRPGDPVVRRNLATTLTWAGRHREAEPVWIADLTTTGDGCRRMDHRIGDEMKAGRLRSAAAMARVFAAVRHGLDGHPGGLGDGPWRAPRAVSLPKLAHDVEQFTHLRRRGVLPEAFDDVIEAYRATGRRLAPIGPEARVRLDDDAARLIGATYGRLVHVADAPEVDRALSDRWDAAGVERAYLAHPAGLVVVDDFLSPDALALLRRFVHDSTIWSGNRYTHGRLGTFFRDGFNAPLLVQVAEELRAALPRVIGDRHPLRQLWAFKNRPSVPPDASVHADFAAVNVNFWITPTEDNLDPASGGMLVYDVGAPPHWDFGMYNGRHELIRAYLRGSGARATYVPYRSNRAVIFNSDLFHETAAVRFAPRYDARRVNVTLLYGEREEDVDHPMHTLAPAVASGGGRHWRSSALVRPGAARRR